jgi:hypothetical protein
MTYQGRKSHRIGLIINNYIQQALSNLFSVLQGDRLSVDSAIQCVRDIQNLLIKWHVQVFSIISLGEEQL